MTALLCFNDTTLGPSWNEVGCYEPCNESNIFFSEKNTSD